MITTEKRQIEKRNKKNKSMLVGIIYKYDLCYIIIINGKGIIN